MALYVTSDTHIGHAGMMSPRMSRPRPFASVEEHDERIIAAWNNRVRPTDQIWHLGDFAFGCSAEHARAAFGRLNGVKHLIWGNHDGKRVRSLPWASQQERAEITAGGRTFVLSHYAQRTWNRSHYGVIRRGIRTPFSG